MCISIIHYFSYQGLNIRTKIEAILKDFGCDLEIDKPVIVTDRGSNMIKAFSDAENIYCVNHLLNNAVEKAIHAIPEMQSLVSNCSKLVKYFKKKRNEFNTWSILEELLSDSVEYRVLPT